MGNKGLLSYLSGYLPTTVQHKPSPVLPEVDPSQHHAMPRHLTLPQQSSLVTFPPDCDAFQPLHPTMQAMNESSQSHAESSVRASTTETYDLFEYACHLEEKIEKLEAKNYRHAQQFQDAYKQLQGQTQQLQVKLVHTREECEKLQIDNIELREHINNTRGSKPVHADEKYVNLIEHLNEKSKSWVAGLSKSGEAGDIEPEMEVVLETLGKTAYCCSVLNALEGILVFSPEFLGTGGVGFLSFDNCFGRQSRRESFSVSLWARGWLQQALGQNSRNDDQARYTLSCLVIDLQEKSFSNVFVAQQLLGRATLVEAKPYQDAEKKRTAKRIISFLHRLFPHADPETLRKKVLELLPEAIELANLMTEE
jgi:hypothetical protein